MAPITIREVAEQLHLSITTVSRALDGYSDVAEETRRRVVQTAREMGYSPSRAARQLRRQRSDTIGYVVPMASTRFKEPFFSEFISGLGDEVSIHDYDLLVATAEPGSEAEQNVYQRWVQGRKVDGIVLNRVRLIDWRVQYLAEQSFPFVSLERSQDPSDQPSIEIDNQAGMVRMIQYLAGKGHRRIAYIGAPSELKIQVSRLAGYYEGLAQVGLPGDPALVAEANLTSEGGFLAAKHLLAMIDPPTAITCVNDLTAMGALHAAFDQGLRVGTDLAVTGFDGIDESLHTQPPLTTLYQPVYEIARQLVGKLLAEIAGETLDERQVCLQPELIIRQSA